MRRDGALLSCTRWPMPYLLQRRVSAAVFPGKRAARINSKEVRMDSQHSQKHLILTVCGTSKAHGNGEMEETGHGAHK